MQETKRASTATWAAAVFLLAFALRILHIAAIYRHSPFFDVLPGDLGAYDRWASRIVAQGWLGTEVFYQDPLYPYFLALLYKVVGRDFLWIYAIQAFLGAWTAFLLVLLGTRVFSRLAGILAGLLYGLYAPAVFYDGLLLKVSLAAFLITLAVYLFLRKGLWKAGPGQYLSGFFFGLACLTRANFLLLVPVFLLAVWLNRGTLLRHRLAVLSLFLAGVVSALAPVVARNYVVGGELVLTTAQAGQNFYIGHNPEANGTYIRLPFVRPDPMHEQEDFRKEAEKRTGGKLSPAASSSYWFRQGLQFIRTNPLADLALTGKKLLLFVNSYEIPDNHNFYFHRQYSKIVANLPFNFGLVMPFSLLGFVGMLSTRRPGTVFLCAVQITYVVSVVLFYVFSRYRMPVLPLFCLTASYGFAILVEQLRMGQWRKFLSGLVIVVLGFGITRYQVMEPFDFSHSYTDEGIAYELKGEEERALDAYLRALEIRPQYMRALERLGKLQMQRMDYRGARATYGKILGIDPGSVEAKYQLMWLDRSGL